MFAILGSGALLRGSQPSTPKAFHPMLFVAGALLALMIGFRYEVGPDWPPYSYIFYLETPTWSLAQSVRAADPAFYVLAWAAHSIEGQIWVVNLICAAIFCTGLIAFARRQPSPWLAVLIAFPYLCVVVAMSGTRQAAAIGFLFLGLNAYRDRSLIRFMIWLGLGAVFHASVALMVPICLLSSSRNRFQAVLLVVVGVILARWALSSSFDIYTARYSGENVQSTGVWYRVAMNAFAAILFFMFGRRFAIESTEYSLWRNFSIISVLIIFALPLVPSSTALDRFILYLFPLQSLVFGHAPWAVSDTKRGVNVFVLGAVAYSGLILLVYLTLSEYGSYYIPYSAFFLNGETTYVAKYR